MSPTVRRRCAPWVISLLLLLSMQAAAGPDDQDRSKLKIMPLGDSITEGYDGRHSYRWHLWHLIRQAGFEIDFVGSVHPEPMSGYEFDTDHEGHWGFSTTSILRNLPSWLAENTPDIVLLHIGTNDIHHCRNTAETVQTIGEIIDQIRRHNQKAIILLAKIIPTTYDGYCDPGESVGEIVRDLNQRLDLIPNTKPRVIVVDLHSAIDVASDLRDGTHPNDRGFQKMAEKWFQALKPILAGEH